VLGLSGVGGIASIVGFSGTAAASPTCTINFNNTAGGGFSTASNWNDATTPTTHRVPGATDFACIPSTITGAVTFSGTNISVLGVSARGSGGFAISSGTLTLGSTTEPSTIAKLGFSGGTITGAGNLTLTGTSTWSSGIIDLTGTATSSGTLTVTGINTSQLWGPLTNSGTLTIPAGDALELVSPGVLTNAVGGTIDLAGSGSGLHGYSGEGQVVNNGTINAALTSGTATISTSLTTSLANLKMAAGTEEVSLTDGGSLSGTETVPSGTIFSLDYGSFALNGATFSGAGLTRLTSATVTATLTGTTTVNTLFSLSGGTITGAGNLTLTGTSTWSSGIIDLTGTTTSSGTLTVTGINTSQLWGPLTNSGTLTIPAGDSLELVSPGVLTNAVGGTIDLAGSGSGLHGYSGEGQVVNNGTINAALTSGTATISTSLTNNATGVINLGAATLAATDGFTNSGTVNIGYQTFNVTGGLTLTNKGTLAFDVSASAHGTLTSSTPTKLGGHVAIALASGYTPAVGTAVTLITTTGTQSGSFIVDSTQAIGSTNTGWKMATKGNKVTITVRPLSDVAGSITAPATATQTVPFTVNASVSNNGPEAANSAVVTLSLPSSIAVSGSLPTGCTQPTSKTVKCAAGLLATGASKIFPVTLVASASGSDTITASAATANTDLVPGNNKDSVVVTAI
jgi:hypothetical protein